MKEVKELLTSEEAIAKFPDYVREIYESKEYNYLYQPLVAVYHDYSPDEETWDIDHWILVFSSDYGMGVLITDVWRHSKAVPEITTFYLPNSLWEKMREVA